MEDCSKSSELREIQKKILHEQVTTENQNKETSIAESIEKGLDSEKLLNE